MKKKILAFTLVIAMLAIAIVGGTMAYFTDSDAKKNAITIGNIEIELVEVVDEEAILLPANTGSMAAGTTDTARQGNKVVDIKNVGNAPAYVRLLIAVEDTKDVGAATFINSAYGANGITKTSTTPVTDVLASTSANGDYLQITDGETVYTVYYITLSEPLAAGASTQNNTWPLLKGILIKNTADNAWTEIVGDTYDVLVLAQGSQVIDSTKNANENIDTAFGFTMNYQADAQIAKLFTDAGLGFFSAHTYTAEGAWAPNN